MYIFNRCTYEHVDGQFRNVSCALQYVKTQMMNTDSFELFQNNFVDQNNVIIFDKASVINYIWARWFPSFLVRRRNSSARKQINNPIPQTGTIARRSMCSTINTRLSTIRRPMLLARRTRYDGFVRSRSYYEHFSRWKLIVYFAFVCASCIICSSTEVSQTSDTCNPVLVTAELIDSIVTVRNS